MSNQELNQIKILLAEDNPDWHGAVKDVVTEIGATLITTTSFEQAAKLLMTGVYDIAILDGSLKRKKGRIAGEHNQDAKELIKLIKEKKLKTKTIGFGGTAIVEADEDVGKDHYDLLAAAIMTLLIKIGAA
ncbi:MAG: response regulator [Candidatus Pacebacteria bacterium]|nr:response regulator [Candidatus Paceibacterota bacterium]